MKRLLRPIATLTSGVLVAAALSLNFALPAYADDEVLPAETVEVAAPIETNETTGADVVPDAEAANTGAEASGVVPEASPEAISEESSNVNTNAGAEEQVVPQAAPEAVAPSVITNLGVAQTQAAVTVSWNAPANDGGDPELSYEVKFTPLFGGDDVILNTAATSLTTSALVPLDTYVVLVTASNSAGSSAGTDSNSFVVGEVAPNAVTALDVQVSSGTATRQLDVSWLSDNAAYMADELKYAVQVSDAEGVIWSDSTQSTNITTAGIPVGIAVTVSVTAQFRDFSSDAVTKEITVSATAPSAPEVKVTVDELTALVEWTTPANGGSALTNYNLELFKGNESVLVLEPISILSSHLFTGLQPNTDYTVVLTANNAIGSSTGTVSNFTTPVVKPTAAQTVVVNGTTVNWTAPASNGGQALTYDVVVKNADGDIVEEGEVAKTSYQLTGQYTAGATYKISVTSSNSRGDGPTTTIDYTKSVAPGAPTGTKLTVSGLYSLTGTWSAPSFTGDTAVTKYVVELINITTNEVRTIETTGTSIVFENLASDSEYSFSVKAVNAGGAGEASVSSGSAFTAPAALTDYPTEAELADFIKNLDGVTTTVEGNVITAHLGAANANQWFFGVAYSTPTALGWAYSDANGNVSFNVAGLPAGNHTFLVYNNDGVAVGSAAFAIAGAAVAADGDDAIVTGVLASTGGELPWNLIFGSAGALLLGAVLIVSARRRKEDEVVLAPAAA